MFQRLKEILGNTVRLAPPKDDQEFCLFTDASDSHWGLILTQIPQIWRNNQINKGINLWHSSVEASREHEIAGSVIEKEAYPTIEATDKLRHFLTRGKPFSGKRFQERDAGQTLSLGCQASCIQKCHPAYSRRSLCIGGHFVKMKV